MTPFEIEVVARTLWGEDRGDGQPGMEAVACVIRNRAALGGWWGFDPVSVCLHPLQFSCWNNGDPNHEKLLAVTTADPSFVLALQIAADLPATDQTNGADSYFATGSPVPNWARNLQPCAVIGNQQYYKTR